MRNVKIVKLSPEKANIKYTVEKVGKDLEDVFAELVEELKEKKKATPRTIIYCKSIKVFGELYSFFDEELSGHNYLFAMYHSKTPPEIQQFVLNTLVADDGDLRVVFATSALGMGVNIPDIQRIIHYGVPGDMEQYVQEVGRGGRDGGQALAVLKYTSYHLSNCDATMRQYVKGDGVKCRRDFICGYFKEKAKKMSVKHVCCDLCSNNCMCGECKEEKEDERMVEAPSVGMRRSVEDSERVLLEDTLRALQKDFRKQSVLGSGALTSLNDSLLQDIISNFESIFTVKFLMENFAIFDKSLAQEVITVFSDVFGDIKELEYCNSMLESEDFGDGGRYDNLPDWSTEPCTDSQHDQTDEEV